MSLPPPVNAGHGADKHYFGIPYVPTAMAPSNPPASIAASVASGSTNDATYTNDPNAEGVTPANPQANALAYSLSGNGQIYGWNIAQQKWL